MLNTRHLRVFTEVCKYMNMTRASKELYISQPAISKTILEIEEEYNVHLFDRWNKALYLTSDGRTLLEYSRQIVELMDRMDTDMREHMWTDIIRVGASITVGTSILSDIVVAYREQNPKVKIEVVVDNTYNIEELLLNRKLDIGIVEGRFDRNSVNGEIIGKTEIVLVVNKEHPLYYKETVTLKDLEGQDFIVREKGSQTRECFAQEMERLNIRWTSAWACHNTQAIKNAVEAGCGIGVLSKLSVRRRLCSGQFRSLEVFERPLTLDLNIVYHAYKYFSPNLTEFKSFLINAFNELNQERNMNKNSRALLFTG